MLTLPIKRKWFDMIASGEKKEEYRDVKQYYRTRLVKLDYPCKIRFRAGYSKKSPLMECTIKSLSLGLGIIKWGAEPETQYFILAISESRNITTASTLLDQLCEPITDFDKCETCKWHDMGLNWHCVSCSYESDMYERLRH